VKECNIIFLFKKNIMQNLLVFIGMVLVALVGFQVYLTLKNKRPDNSQQDAEVKVRLETIEKSVSEKLGLMLNQFDVTTKRLDKRFSDSSSTMNERLDKAAKAVGDVSEKLAKLDEANKRIFDVGKDISSLQEILQAPKLRGGLGELMLGEILKQYLPMDSFDLQYRFKNGLIVDAALKTAEGKLLCIDSKFPLENFKKMLDANEEAEKKSFRKVFVSDVKKHIDAISSKYILPAENTYDFAFMYIPAENVYYEIISNDELDAGLNEYARSKNIFPVSPNTFYSYLQVIIYGLKAFEISEQTQEILTHLGDLNQSFEKVADQFGKLGTHINHAHSSYAETDKRLEKFSDKLVSLESGAGAKRAQRSIKAPQNATVREEV